MEHLLARIQDTPVATAIGGSTLLTGLLSGIHLLGLTLVVGSAVVSGLRLVGLILTDRPVGDVMAGPGRGLIVGLVISITSGLLLFSARASVAAVNGIFQVKMLLLCAAIAFHFGVYRKVDGRSNTESTATKFTGGLGLALWLAVAVAGCAFILLE